MKRKLSQCAHGLTNLRIYRLRRTSTAPNCSPAPIARNLSPLSRQARERMRLRNNAMNTGALETQTHVTSQSIDSR